jgi:hypothetical protein
LRAKVERAKVERAQVRAGEGAEGEGAEGEGAGEGNRTLMTSLEGWGSAIELRPRGGSEVPGSAIGSVPGHGPSPSPPAARYAASPREARGRPASAQRRQLLTSAEYRPEQVALLRHPLRHSADREGIGPQRRIIELVPLDRR